MRRVVRLLSMIGKKEMKMSLRTTILNISKSDFLLFGLLFSESVSGKPLFRAPINRSVDAFMTESAVHGWPSFRDDEVVWENVRVLKSSGETVSIGGTHLGHNLPDKSGNRYCINLVSIAGNP